MALPLKITINGEEKIVEHCETLPCLIKTLDLNGDRLAIELNGQIIRRANWDSVRLVDGDRLEIVHFVGGGSK